MYSPFGKRQGFTIVELLIVVVVIAILATIVIVAYNGIMARANDSATTSSASQAGKKIMTYAVRNAGQLPAALADAGVANSGDTVYQYTLNTAVTPSTYCLTVTNGKTWSHIASTGEPTRGPCNGHTGTAPSTLDDGSSCPTGYILVPGNSLFHTQAFCVMKYEAKITGNNTGTTAYASSMVAESRATGTPWVNITQTNAIAEASALGDGYHLVTDNEWLTIAHNVLNVGSNWYGGVVGTNHMYYGHTDGTPSASIVADASDANGYANTGNTADSNRRTLTLSNGQVIWDFSGNVMEWTDQTTTGAGRQPGPSSAAYAYREWNAANTLAGDFAKSFPAYGTSAAAGWTSSRFIGMNYSSTTDATTIAVRRGGYWLGAGNNGIFTIHFGAQSSAVLDYTGFRVSKS